MQKNTGISVAVVALVVGVVVGYVVGAGTFSSSSTDQNVSGMHRMPDGSLMSNNTETMSMADMMADMNAALAGKKGDAFDRAFLSEMIVHHQGAVEMAELALTNAQHQEIKDLAKAIISAQNKEIADMKKWQMEWWGR